MATVTIKNGDNTYEGTTVPFSEFFAIVSDGEKRFRCYFVYHLPTGLKASMGFRKRTIALRYARLLHALGDWSGRTLKELEKAPNHLMVNGSRLWKIMRVDGIEKAEAAVSQLKPGDKLP